MCFLNFRGRGYDASIKSAPHCNKVIMAESSSGVVAAAKQTGTKRASCKFTNLGIRAGNHIKHEILQIVRTTCTY